MGVTSADIPADAPQENLKIISFEGRKLPANYHSVVIARWLNSLQRLNKYFKMIDRDSYYREYEKYVKAIIARPQVQIRIAALAEDIDVIFGWAVYEGDVLHYIHIQEPYRGLKISYDLIPQNTRWISHVTNHWEKCFSKASSRFKSVKFNPFVY